MATKASVSAAAADWDRFGDHYYRKYPVFPTTWPQTVPGLQVGEFSLDGSFVAAAPLGGPIALIRDDRLVQSVRMGLGETRMRVFSSSGQLLSQFLWPHRGLVAVGWSDDERLVCVLDDGLVLLYSIHGAKTDEFRLGEACRTEGVAEVCIFGNGLVVRSGTRGILECVTSFTDPVVTRLPDPALKAAATSMAVIPPAVLSSASSRPGAVNTKLPVVFLGTARGSVVTVDANQPQPQRQVVEFDISSVPNAAAGGDGKREALKVTHLCVSPHGSSLALFAGGTVEVISLIPGSGAVRGLMFRFNTMAQKPPAKMLWCGNDVPALFWDQPRSLVLLAGPRETFVSYTFSSPLVLASECDGLRVVSESACEFVQRVPDSVVLTLAARQPSAPQSDTAPSALLFEAKAAFDNGSAQADDVVRDLILHNTLPEAVTTCLDAALHELNPATQTQLLAAASFGRLSCSGIDDLGDDDAGEDAVAVDRVVDTCRALRVINSVRTAAAGMALTSEQYETLGVDRLVDRLVAQHQHLLAFRVSQYMRASPARVLVHWAKAKIAAAPSIVRDADLAAAIVSKFALCPGLSYGPVALAASKLMRRQLAAALLEFEPRASDQVPLLLAIREDDVALAKAVQSGDTDLIVSVLMQLKNTLALKDLIQMLADKPLARNLFVAHCRKYDLEMLKNYYYMQAMPVEAGNIAVIQAYEGNTLSKRQEKLKNALELYKRDAAQNPLPAQLLEDEKRLLDDERALGPEFVDMSVSDVIEALLADSQRDRALKVKQDYKVPDRRFWHIEVKTLARRGHWGSLAKLVANKRAPPIGFTPFIEACIDNNAPHEAVQYIQMLPEPHEQIEWLCNIQRWKEAADIAFKERDAEALSIIRARCRNQPLMQAIDKMISQVGGK